MNANRFDVAAEAPIINTYVPINFDELHRIGTTQKAAIDKAAELFGAALQKFGEFRSPSSVDTENWYKMTINRSDIQDAITQMVSNPDALKDASFRAGLQSMINNTDYAGLSLLKESANNLRAGLEMRAKMEAEGRYKRSWDKSNIPQYDTLGSNRVFEDITPTKYMTANELSNAYFDNLKPSTLGSLYVNGVKYDRSGITYDTLYNIASARFNDLVSTPQGKEYYKEILAANNGDSQLAKQQFIGMIADSQKDREIIQDTINPYWLAMAKYNARYSGSGKDKIIETEPTRIDFINNTIDKNIGSKMFTDLGDGNNRLGRTMTNLEKYIKDNPKTKRAKTAVQDLQTINQLQSVYEELTNRAVQYTKAHEQTGKDEYFAAAVETSKQMKKVKDAIASATTKYAMMDEFENVANFSIDDINKDKFSHEGYNKGVKAALDLAKGTVSLMKDDDLLTGVGGIYDMVSDKNGTKHVSYVFNNTAGFVLPETIFNVMTGVDARTITKNAPIWGSDKYPLKELIESGSIDGVHFLPDNEGVRPNPGAIALSGKLRIPKTEIERTIGRGLGFLGWDTKTAFKNIFSGKKVQEIINEDGVEFYELDAYRVLPNFDENSEYSQRVDQRWVGGGDPGIGGTSQAKEAYMGAAKLNLLEE